MTSYGERIRIIRQKNNDTIDDLARKINLSVSGLGKYERGERKAGINILKTIANVYNVPLTQLIGDGSVVTDVPIEWREFISEMVSKGISPSDLRNYVRLSQLIKEIAKENIND